MPQRDDVPVTVELRERDAHLLARHYRAEPVSGCVTEGLGLLGCDHPCEADSMLLPVGVEDGDRIAIGDIEDGAFEDAGSGAGRWRRDDERQQSEEEDGA
jgi:hypothetical protein